jgi:glutamyl endopeptidase
MFLLKLSQKISLTKTIGLLSLGAAIVGPPVFGGPHDPVASDGSVVFAVDGVRESGGDTAASRPYRGTGKLTGTEGVSLVAPNVQELRTLPAWNLPAPGTGKERKATEAIVGFDTRVRTYTLSYPATAVALVTFENARCTGWFIGPDTIATAGHCVHSGGSGGNWYDVNTYTVYPGFDRDQAPFGSCRARTLYSVTGWTQSGDPRFDYGAIKLDCTVGNAVGCFGFFWTSASLNGQHTVVSGYPGDKELEQWWSTDRVRQTYARQLAYRNDTVGGQSGAPVWQDNPPDRDGVYAMAIHTYGGATNLGTRITKAVFNNLLAWKNAP